MSVDVMQLNDAGLTKRWIVFIHERFPIMEHFLSILLLTSANAVVACSITNSEIRWSLFIVSFLVSLSFFFRLRCFDEIKDLSVDKNINPNRPLARGLLTVVEVKRMIFILTTLELVTVAFINIEAAITFSIAVVYSFLMYQEFFIGKILSRYLTTYALTHTVVSVAIAYSIFSINTTLPITDFTPSMFIFGLSTWAIFNLFEFARKSFAAVEERENVASYTSIFGITGATILSLSQIYLAVATLVYLYLTYTVFSLPDITVHILVASIPTIVGLTFIVKKNKQWAGYFRAVCAVYLIVYYAIVTYQGFSAL